MVSYEEIKNIRAIYGLKTVYRWNSVEERKESSAEHTWSALMLADALQGCVGTLDMKRVFELLLYHDLVEIETGDMPIHPEKEHLRKDKEATEQEGAKKFSKKLPLMISQRYLDLFEEFEEQQTREAQYAKAMDSLDGALHALDSPKDYEGFRKEDFVEKKRKYFLHFPELLELFDELTQWMDTHNYFTE